MLTPLRSGTIDDEWLPILLRCDPRIARNFPAHRAQARLRHQIATLIVAEEGFAALAHPLDRPPDAPRGPQHQREFRKERVLGAEVSTDVERDTRICSGCTPRMPAISPFCRTTPRCRVQKVAPARLVVFPTAARASIGTPVTRWIQLSKLTTWAAFANARSVAAASPTSASRKTFEGAWSQTSGAFGSAAAAVSTTAGSVS